MLLSLPISLASGAGQKSNGSTVIADDLPTGSAGSVGLTGGIAEIDGSLGQIGAAELSAGGPVIEAGYFSFLQANWYLGWNSAESINTRGVSWGDFDNDGDIDFAEGTWNNPNRIYSNNGDGTFVSIWNDSETNRIYRNKGGGIDSQYGVGRF
ncbi:FG-GAP repeat domain-containing protein [Elusimicrobiota bacterium]